MATHVSILAWRIPWTEILVGYSPQGHEESDTTKVTEHTHTHTHTHTFNLITWLLPRWS